MGQVVFWSTMWIGMFIFFISWIKMRDAIPTHKRDRIEQIIMVCLIILLLVDIGLVIRERRDLTYDVNDCIRYFRYNPSSIEAEEFNFIQRCHKLLDDHQFNLMRKSGINYYLTQEREIQIENFDPNDVEDITEDWDKYFG